MENYRCVTSVQEIRDYIGDATIVAFDYETAPDETYRTEEKAALDPHKSHIMGCSFSVKEHTGIYIPVAHKIGENIDNTSFLHFLKFFLTNKNITKIAHNIVFESAVSCHKNIVIQPPVYDTICAAQMTLKSNYEFRKLADSGLKRLSAEICHEPLPTFSDVTSCFCRKCKEIRMNPTSCEIDVFQIAINVCGLDFSPFTIFLHQCKQWGKLRTICITPFFQHDH